MRTIKKNVYYCDYCNKHGLSASHIVTHERYCTANPSRRCRLCGYSSGFVKTIAKLKKRFTIIKESIKYMDIDIEVIKWKNKEITLDELRDITNNCPNCILTIIRGVGLNHYGFDFNFNYQHELSEHWKIVNDEARMAEEDYTY